jgi:saccharopine dehydrogenase-like NADP-dependent oxidoreductase
MRVIVLGCGMIGSVIAKDFSENIECDMTLADQNSDRAKKVASMIEGAKWVRVDAKDNQSLVENLRGFDIILGALPGDLGYKALEAAIEVGISMVDVSFTPEPPMNLNEAAKETGITLIPDCGVAPGLSNMLVGYAYSKLDRVRNAHIMVGGIPETYLPPLGYTLTWSAEGLIDEYVRPVNIVEDGRVKQVPALSGIEEIEFPGVGKLEAFYTDGLRSLIESLPEVENMWEKTLRYPGHAEKIQLLRNLGFFDDKLVNIGDVVISPKIFTARILERTLNMPDVGDLLAMFIRVQGEKLGEEKGYEFHILDYFNREKRVTAMARTTGYTTSIVARMVARGEIKEKGVIPVEILGFNPKLTEKILTELNNRGVIVNQTTI